ncbi:hypothetical protein J7438_07635 [Thalassotalea sp. G20_0]|nr:hypothetical protein [Thalassotalea sp. G20_0]
MNSGCFRIEIPMVVLFTVFMLPFSTFLLVQKGWPVEIDMAIFIEVIITSAGEQAITLCPP